MSELQNRSIPQRTKVLIEKLLLGKFTLAEIAKITGISEQWLQTYVNATAIVELTQMLF
jgi:phage repressor protein C with HTH and peptisase S24 domain